MARRRMLYLPVIDRGCGDSSMRSGFIGGLAEEGGGYLPGKER